MDSDGLQSPAVRPTIKNREDLTMQFHRRLTAALTAFVIGMAMTGVIPVRNSPANTVHAADGVWADMTYNNSSAAGLTKQGKLYVWGEGDYGNASRNAPGRSSPVRVPFDGTIVDICNSYALTDTGEVYYISYDTASPTPTLVLSGVKKLCPDAAITNAGELYLLGDVEFDGNGHDFREVKRQPTDTVKVEGLTDVVSAYNCQWECAAVTADGSLYTWGSNVAGQGCGNGHLGYFSDYPEYESYSQLELYPRKVDVGHVVDAKMQKIINDLYVLQEDGTLLVSVCDYDAKTVSFVPLFEHIREYSVGESFHGGGGVMAVSDDGRLFFKGSSIWGLGDGQRGTTSDVTRELTQFGAAAQGIVTGDNFAVLTQNGELYTWGENTCGVIGNGQVAAYDSDGLGDPNSQDVYVAYQVKVEEELLCGDVNGDSLVNAADASEILIAAAQLGAGEAHGLTADQVTAADVNGDGVINASDAALVQMYAAMTGAGEHADWDSILGAG